MPTNNEILSQKYNNYNYAPGVATYGIDGKTGETGYNGNNIFYTDYDITNDSNIDLPELMIKITQNMLPIKGQSIKLDREYIASEDENGDMFFNRYGVIFKLINKDFKESEAYHYTTYFKIVGSLSIEDNAQYFDFSSNDRLILNKKYSGYDIITLDDNNSDVDQYINNDSVVNIVSNNINNDNNIEMLRMQSIDNIDIEDGNLLVYYKTTDNAYYIDSNKPIVINGDLKVDTANNTLNEYDNFSTVLASDDTITYFKYLCDKLQYNIVYDESKNKYKLVIYQKDGKVDALKYLVSRNETVYGKIYTNNDEQILMKLNNIINETQDTTKYYNTLSPYDLDMYIMNPNGFNIIGDNTSCAINATDILIETNKGYNNGLNVSIYLKNSEYDYVSKGIATSNQSDHTIGGDTIDVIFNTSEGIYTLYDVSQHIQNSPYGLAFNGQMNVSNNIENCIEIIPGSDIDNHMTIELEVYKVEDSSVILYIKDQNNSNIFEYELNANKSDDTDLNKNIEKIIYNFGENTDTQNNIYSEILIGFNNSAGRLHSYKLINDAEQTQFKNKCKELLLNNVFTLNVNQVANISTYELNSVNIFNSSSFISPIKSELYNSKGIYKFNFDMNKCDTILPYINFNIYPLTEYEYFNSVIPISFNVSINNNMNGEYTLYFEIDRSELTYAIKNIMLFDNDDMLFKNSNNTVNYIESYIPNNVNSIIRFSLLHNTEVFLNYYQ